MPERVTVAFLESHPVQYRAPVYQCLERLRPGTFLVFYGTDRTVRGYPDRDFGCTIAWNTFLLQGYRYEVLNCERGTPLTGIRSLHGRTIVRSLRRIQPRAVVFSQFAYELEWVAYLYCRLAGIQIWIRQETQDEAYIRGWWKDRLRTLVYRMIYRGVSRAFYIGELNRQHLHRHGIDASRMTVARYCVAHPLAEAPEGELMTRREAWRRRWGVANGELVVSFVGKLIKKKNPDAILGAYRQLPAALAERTRIVFVGSGELEAALKLRVAKECPKAIFCGFVNQAELPEYYLGADIVVLPSRRMGETWGLVINEALQAGCGAVISSAAGCSREFGGWERVRVVLPEDAGAIAGAIADLAVYPRDFDWCKSAIAEYSVERTAEAFAAAIDSMKGTARGRQGPRLQTERETKGTKVWP